MIVQTTNEPTKIHPERMSPREIRLIAGWPVHKLAVVAGVGVYSVRLYEANPAAIADPDKRAHMARVYANLASLISK